MGGEFSPGFPLLYRQWRSVWRSPRLTGRSMRSVSAGAHVCAHHSKSATRCPPPAECLREFRGFKKCFRFIWGHAGSFLLHMDFLWLWRAGATLRSGAWVSHCGGFACCRARAPGVQCLGSVVTAHGLSCSTACGIFLGIHCATKEVPQRDFIFRQIRKHCSTVSWHNAHYRVDTQ